MLKGGAAGSVEDEQGTAGTAEVAASDALVGFLAGGIPEGEFHVFLIGTRRGDESWGWVRRVVEGGRWWWWWRRRTDGDDPGAEFDTDGHVVRG